MLSTMSGPFFSLAEYANYATNPRDNTSSQICNTFRERNAYVENLKTARETRDQLRVKATETTPGKLLSQSNNTLFGSKEKIEAKTTTTQPKPTGSCKIV